MGVVAASPDDLIGGGVTPATASALGWSGFAVSALLLGAGFAIAVPAASSDGALAVAVHLVASLGFACFSAVGALIVSRHRSHLIGWLFCGAGQLWALTLASDAYVQYTYVRRLGRLPGKDLMTWLYGWSGFVAIGLTVMFLLLLFPTGKLLSRRWRPVAWLAALSLLAATVSSMFGPESGDYPEVPNPYGLRGPAGELFGVLRGVAWVLVFFSLLGALASIFVRFRRSRGDERQQLKWMLFSASLLVVSFAGWGLLEEAGGEELAGIAMGLGLISVPIAVGVAILKYRLYDIDVIINRTLVYGALTTVLALTYFGLVVLFQQALTPLTETSNLAVAASTLAVAALFRPLRTRIQAWVDRRFYRAKYDAAKTLEAFSARLRDEIELDALRGELLAVVRRSMQPAHLSLWLRSPADPEWKTTSGR